MDRSSGFKEISAGDGLYLDVDEQVRRTIMEILLCVGP